MACRPPNKCCQAWTGVIVKAAFPDRFLVVNAKSEMAARLVFEDHGVTQYFDIAKAAMTAQE